MVAVTTVPRLPREKMTGEVLEDKKKNGKPRPWRRHKQENFDIAEAYSLSGEQGLSERIAACGSWLCFAECPVGHQRKLINSNFCRARLCSMCSSRRALLIASQVRSVGHSAILQQPDLQFLLLTLTVENISGACISQAITDLFTAFQRLCRVPEVKRVATGYFRALEITYSKRRHDYHPHLHVLLAVPGRYFQDWYIERDRWLAHWRRATQNPRITQVDVRKVKPKRGGEDKLAGAAAEVGKYAVTGKDIIQKTPRETAEVLQAIHGGLRGRRTTQFGRLLFTIKKQLKLIDAENATLKDLVAVGNDPNCFCGSCQLPLVEHVYRWCGGRNGEYVG